MLSVKVKIFLEYLIIFICIMFISSLSIIFVPWLVAWFIKMIEVIALAVWKILPWPYGFIR